MAMNSLITDEFVPTVAPPVSDIIVVEDLWRTYDMGSEQQVQALRGVSLRIKRNEYVAIMGPSGSGKSTLMNLIGCLDTPSKGSYWLNGQLVSELDDDQLARIRNKEIGFVFQTFQLIPTLTALENVMVPLELRGHRQAREPALELLRRVGLGDRWSHYPFQLSGGEQQRVALARAFINRPKILFADEPTGNLDSETGKLVIDCLFALNSGAGTTLVLVTHDIELAGRTQRIIRLKGGLMVNGS